MEVQQNILKKIKNDTNDLLKSQIFPSISELIEVKMKEETDKFFEKTNILGDIYPKPIETHGYFSFCGNCDLCNGIYQKNNGGKDYEYWKKECVKTISDVIDEYSGKLYDDEYILLCSRRYIYNNKSNYYYSNYGRLCWISPHCSHPGSIQIVSERWLNRCVMHGNDGRCGRAQPILSEYFNERILLTDEYINLLNTINLNYDNQSFNYHLFNKLIHIYRRFNPKASELYKIEKEKEEVKKMIKGLQEKETGIIKDLESFSKMKKESIKEREEFVKEKEEFVKEKEIHKQKSRNLLKRENNVFLKESIKNVHQELNEISYSLSNVIDLLDDVDPIEQRLNQIINKLNNIFNSDGSVLEAVAVL